MLPLLDVCMHVCIICYVCVNVCVCVTHYQKTKNSISVIPFLFVLFFTFLGVPLPDFKCPKKFQILPPLKTKHICHISNMGPPGGVIHLRPSRPAILVYLRRKRERERKEKAPSSKDYRCINLPHQVYTR